MANSASERNIPGIVPSDEKNYAHIDSKQLKLAKGKLPEPITVKIFGGSINGKILEIHREKTGTP